MVAVSRRASRFKKETPLEFIGPNVSNAKGMKVCVRASAWYFSSFRFAAPSAAPPPDDDVACSYDSARVSVTVTFQVTHFPACHAPQYVKDNFRPSRFDRGPRLLCKFAKLIVLPVDFLLS